MSTSDHLIEFMENAMNILQNGSLISADVSEYENISPIKELDIYLLKPKH